MHQREWIFSRLQMNSCALDEIQPAPRLNLRCKSHSLASTVWGVAGVSTSKLDFRVPWALWFVCLAWPQWTFPRSALPAGPWRRFHR